MASAGGGGGYEYEVTYTGGGTDTFGTEQEALAALSHSGGGMRVVPRSK